MNNKNIKNFNKYLYEIFIKYIKVYITFRYLSLVLVHIIVVVLYIYINTEILLAQPLDNADLYSKSTPEEFFIEKGSKSNPTVNNSEHRPRYAFDKLIPKGSSEISGNSNFIDKDNYITKCKEEFKEFYTINRKSIKLSNWELEKLNIQIAKEFSNGRIDEGFDMLPDDIRRLYKQFLLKDLCNRMVNKFP